MYVCFGLSVQGLLVECSARVSSDSVSNPSGYGQRRCAESVVRFSQISFRTPPVGWALHTSVYKSPICSKTRTRIGYRVFETILRAYHRRQSVRSYAITAFQIPSSSSRCPNTSTTCTHKANDTSHRIALARLSFTKAPELATPDPLPRASPPCSVTLIPRAQPAAATSTPNRQDRSCDPATQGHHAQPRTGLVLLHFIPHSCCE